MLYWIAFVLTYLPIKLFFPTIIKCRSKLKKGNVIFVANHTTNADVVIIVNSLKRKIFTLAKKELFKNKFSTFILKSCGAICINRGKTDISAIKTSMRVLKDNKALLIFPSGSRSISSEEKENIKNGAGLLAIKTNSQIQPIYLLKKPKLFRLNKLIIGDPIAMNFDENINQDEKIKLINENITSQFLKMKQDYLKGEK